MKCFYPLPIFRAAPVPVDELGRPTELFTAMFRLDYSAMSFMEKIQTFQLRVLDKLFYLSRCICFYNYLPIFILAMFISAGWSKNYLKKSRDKNLLDQDYSPPDTIQEIILQTFYPHLTLLAGLVVQTVLIVLGMYCYNLEDINSMMLAGYELTSNTYLLRCLVLVSLRKYVFSMYFSFKPQTFVLKWFCQLGGMFMVVKFRILLRKLAFLPLVLFFTLLSFLSTILRNPYIQVEILGPLGNAIEDIRIRHFGVVTTSRVETALILLSLLTVFITFVYTGMDIIRPFEIAYEMHLVMLKSFISPIRSILLRTNLVHGALIREWAFNLFISDLGVENFSPPMYA